MTAEQRAAITAYAAHCAQKGYPPADLSALLPAASAAVDHGVREIDR
jgi:hypothetical protein